MDFSNAISPMSMVSVKILNDQLWQQICVGSSIVKLSLLLWVLGAQNVKQTLHTSQTAIHQ